MSEWKAKPATASAAAPISVSLTRCATQRFVVAVGEFTAETGEEKVRSDENCAGELNQGRGIGAGNLIDDQEAERRLEEVVAERGEELTREQRRETARRHQGLEHRSPAVCLHPAG